MHVSDRIALNHLDRMTDSTGLIQHAIYSIPRRESGYTTDDNARALRLCVRLWDQQPEERMLSRVTTYLSFLEHARCLGRGFHNFLELSSAIGWMPKAAAIARARRSAPWPKCSAAVCPTDTARWPAS